MIKNFGIVNAHDDAYALYIIKNNAAGKKQAGGEKRCLEQPLGFVTDYLYYKYFPFVRMSKKAMNDKPHITSGIKVSIRHKERLVIK